MKILIYGNAPNAGTGYGVQVANLVVRLKRDGHDVAVACTYGHQIGVKTWPTEYGPVTLYPSGYADSSLDVFFGHALHFFEGDPKAGWIIPLTDIWVLNSVAKQLAEYQVLAWTPVDHMPIPSEVLAFFHLSNATPVAMSKFGRQQFYEFGLTPEYVPLSVDLDKIKPTSTITIGGTDADARTLFGVPAGAFVVGSVAMNKDFQDRKNFNGILRAFGAFWKRHNHAVLLMHTDRFGAAGSRINLPELAIHAGVPVHALIFTDAYAQRIGFGDDMMSAFYTACDVLLAPSKGEGFGVPMIEAQACGTPVIASDFTAQTELVGPGWLVAGQLDWDQAQHASYFTAYTADIVDKLEDCYHADLATIAADCKAFAADYDADHVYDTHWRPLLASLEPWVPPADKPVMTSVDVIVPLVRDSNRARLEQSFAMTAPLTARLIEGQHGRTFAENVNACYRNSTADWVLVVGDDCQFTPGWFEAAAALSDRYDVIGTNDSEPGRVRNPVVAKGEHADHFFIRRAYIDDEGSSLDGPGVVMPECYRHWWTDKEVIELAKARAVYGHAHDCRIIHHHPGYDGDEAARASDPVYTAAVGSSANDQSTFFERLPWIEAQRVKRGRQ